MQATMPYNSDIMTDNFISSLTIDRESLEEMIKAHVARKVNTEIERITFLNDHSGNLVSVEVKFSKKSRAPSGPITR